MGVGVKEGQREGGSDSRGGLCNAYLGLCVGVCVCDLLAHRTQWILYHSPLRLISEVTSL